MIQEQEQEPRVLCTDGEAAGGQVLPGCSSQGRRILLQALAAIGFTAHVGSADTFPFLLRSQSCPAQGTH